MMSCLTKGLGKVNPIGQDTDMSYVQSKFTKLLALLTIGGRYLYPRFHRGTEISKSNQEKLGESWVHNVTMRRFVDV